MEKERKDHVSGLQDCKDDLKSVEIEHLEHDHLTALTEEELAIEKKLRLRIDLLILPLVVVVYIMNYIDR